MIQGAGAHLSRFIRPAAAILVVSVLTGCLLGAGQPSASDLQKSPIFGGGKPTPTANLRRKVNVMGGKVLVVAPKGYCVDEVSLVDRPKGAFVALGACAALTGNGRDPKPDTPAFLTASVLPMPAQPAALTQGDDSRVGQARGYLESKAGRAALSRSSDASTVTLLEVKASKDVLFAKVKDVAPGLPRALSDTAWRAFFEIDDTVVVVTVTPFKKQSVAQGKGDALLRAFVGEIQKSNSDGTPTSGLKNLFDRLRPGDVSD